MFIPFLAVLFLFGIALGIFGCALVLRLGPASEWLIWPVPALLSPFAGVFYPLATLPRWMQWVSSALPPSYVFEGMRRIVDGGAVSAFTLVLGIGLAAAYILLACRYFVGVYHHAQRTGIIARYSAETLS
jgi:ABC-2 type transport system permease protein